MRYFIFVASILFLSYLVFAQVNIGEVGTGGVIIEKPSITTSSSGGNVSSVTSGDSFVSVSPTTGDVIVSLTTAATQWLYNQTIVQGTINIFDQDLNTTDNVRFNNITLSGNLTAEGEIISYDKLRYVIDSTNYIGTGSFAGVVPWLEGVSSNAGVDAVNIKDDLLLAAATDDENLIYFLNPGVEVYGLITGNYTRDDLRFSDFSLYNFDNNLTVSGNISGVYLFGDGSNLVNVPTENIFDQDLNKSNNVNFNNLTLSSNLSVGENLKINNVDPFPYSFVKFSVNGSQVYNMDIDSSNDYFEVAPGIYVAFGSSSITQITNLSGLGLNVIYGDRKNYDIGNIDAIQTLSLIGLYSTAANVLDNTNITLFNLGEFDLTFNNDANVTFARGFQVIANFEGTGNQIDNLVGLNFENFGSEDHAGQTVINSFPIYADGGVIYTEGRIGINITNPSVPLYINSNISGVSAYGLGSASFDGYITHTPKYDLSKDPYEYLKNASDYLDSKGETNHSLLYGHTQEIIPDTSKPLYKTVSDIRNGKVVNKTIVEYPHNIVIEGVKIDDQIAWLTQLVYQQNEEIKSLKQEISSIKNPVITP